MSDNDALFDSLRQSADPDAVAALETLVASGSDERLAHINALAVAAETGLREDSVIGALLHASRLGLFEMSWNILCPSCGGVLDENATLKSVRNEEYHCAFCGVDGEPRLDDTIEVAFTVSPRVRRIPAHDPASLAFWDYHRQVFFGSGVVFPGPDGFEAAAREALIDNVELEPGEKVILSLNLAEGPVAVFDPVTHAATLVRLEGEPTNDRQELSLVFNALRPRVTRATMRPGPLRLSLDNRTELRLLPGVFLEGEGLKTLIGTRQPHLTAKRLLSNQTFRDIYRTDTIGVDQRLKVMSLTFLFTDLKGSTELYEKVGDLVAYDLVRSHFRLVNEIVAGEGGAVVKTIGDAVMATFPAAHQAVAAALRMREAMRGFNESQDAEDLILKIGIHEGPCLAVSLNDRQDYFGQTVNIASRVQELATSDTIFVTEPVVRHEQSAHVLADAHIDARAESRSLRGIGDRMAVYELT